MGTPGKFFIAGGTGNQGGAIARSLLDRGHSVMVLSRHPSSPKAVALKELGVEIVKGDLNDTDDFADQLEDVHGIFSVQAFMKNTKMEVYQGTQLADVAKAVGVKHFVYTSVAGADQKTGIPHFESKYTIEKYIKKLGLPFTFLRPAVFCENLLHPHLKSGIMKGKLVMPLNKETVQQYISMHDIGIIGAQVFENPQLYMEQILPLATDQMTMAELADLFTEVLNHDVKYHKLPALVTRLAMGKDLTNMFKWMDNNEFTFADINELKANFPGVSSMRNWIEANFK